MRIFALANALGVDLSIKAAPVDVKGSLAMDPIKIPVIPANLPVLTTSLVQFTEMTRIVIDNFEGGYYHPSMLKSFNAKSQSFLKSSGETMFGLDRKAGAQLAQYPEWRSFWSLVDANKVAYPGMWRYNYRGGAIQEQLKGLAASIMYKWFTYLSAQYILPTSRDEIAMDNRLIIHFSYGAWNGEGWFQKYSRALNEAIRLYPGQKEKIFAHAIKARTEATSKNKLGITVPNNIIRQQGTNMISLFKRLHLL